VIQLQKAAQGNFGGKVAGARWGTFFINSSLVGVLKIFF
jgi:hypothetical protein